MDLNQFAKVMSDYLDFYAKETDAFEAKMVEKQNQLLGVLNKVSSANEPQKDSNVQSVLGAYTDLHDEVVKMSKRDHDQLMSTLEALSKTHPELNVVNK